MPERHFDPARAVEVIAASYGSGYRIGGRLVLTAAHLLPPELGSNCKVRFHRDAGAGEWAGKVAWIAPGWRHPDGPPKADVAFVAIEDEAPECEPAMVGQLPNPADVLKLPFHMYGWPDWAQTQHRSGAVRAGGRQIDGSIYLADTSGDGLLVLEPDRSGPTWSGMSGAAVICGGIVVGVQRQHQNPQRPESLEAVALSEFARDADLRRLLSSSAIDTSWPVASVGADEWIRRTLGGTLTVEEELLAGLLLRAYPRDELEALLPPGIPTLPLAREGGEDRIARWALAGLAATQSHDTRSLLDRVTAGDPGASAAIDLVRRDAREHGTPAAAQPEPARRVQARVPRLPEYHVDRPECADLAHRIAEAPPARAGIAGPAGSGKTTMAAALARSETLVAAFDGRIGWLRPDLSGVDFRSFQQQLFAQLGCDGQLQAANTAAGLDALARCVAETQPDGPILVVVDDPPEPLADALDALDCADSVTFLVTSTNAAALRDIAGPGWTLELSGLEPDPGLRLLAAWAAVDVSRLPQPARELAAAVGYMPLALTGMGATARERGGSEAAWAGLVGELDQGEPELAPRQHPHFGAALEDLPAGQRTALERLAVFPAGAALDVEVLTRVWDVEQAADARALAALLAGRSLLVADDDRYVLPALLRQELRAGGADLAELADAVLLRLAPTPPIFHAVAWRDRPLLAALAHRPEYVSARAGPGLTPLHEASNRGWAAGVDELIGAGADVDAAMADGWTALHSAAQTGDLDLLESLLAAGARADTRNDGDKTPLDVAARWGHAAAVRRLLHEDGQTATPAALEMAANHGHTEVVRILLEAGMLSEDDGKGLVVAAQTGHFAVVSMLLDAGADPSRASRSLTPLYIAAQNGHLGIVQELIARGVQVDGVNERGRTALVVAAQESRADVVDALLTAGADPNARDDERYGALHLGCVAEDADIVLRLIAAGADIDALTASGGAPLHFAAQQLDMDCVSALIEHAAAVDRHGAGGVTPLMVAAATQRLDAQQSMTASTSETGTQLAAVSTLAVRAAPAPLIQALLDAGADVRARDSSGNTPLHHAASGLEPSTVALLLHAGAEPDAQNEVGQTPLDVARLQQLQHVRNPALVVRDAALLELLGA